MAKIIELSAGGAVRIGKFDEHNAVHVTADISEFQEMWPNGLPVIVYERPDGVIYNLAGTIAGSILTIPLTNTESCEVGTGRIEIRWTDTDVLAKSVTYKIKFIDGIDEPTTTPDPPGQTYLDQIAGYATDIASRLAEIQSEVDALVVEGDSSVEAAQARVNEAGTTFNTLKARLDDGDSELNAVTSQLAENADNSALWRTATGNPAIIYPVPKTSLYPKVIGSFAQAGSGDPSPDNIRPITSWLANGEEVEIALTDGDTITLTVSQQIEAGWMDNEGNGQVTGAILTLNGTETFIESPVDLGTVVRARYYFATPFRGRGIFSHFQLGVDYMSDTEHAYMDGVLIMLFIAKSRLSTIDDDGVRAWLAAQYAAETPVTIGYELATPISITPTAAPLTALPQLDRYTPRQNVVTVDKGELTVGYSKSPIKESDELKDRLAVLERL